MEIYHCIYKTLQVTSKALLINLIIIYDFDLSLSGQWDKYDYILTHTCEYIVCIHKHTVKEIMGFRKKATGYT